jgi:hypothetical protein
VSSGKYEYLSQTMLNFILNGGTWTAPSHMYLALFSVTPSVSSTGTEATGSGYARLSITSNTTNWPTISGSTTTQQNAVAQTMATATGDWSSAANQVAAGLWDASTSGNLYWWGALTEAKPILNGDTASFAIDALSVQEV